MGPRCLFSSFSLEHRLELKALSSSTEMEACDSKGMVFHFITTESLIKKKKKNVCAEYLFTIGVSVIMEIDLDSKGFVILGFTILRCHYHKPVLSLLHYVNDKRVYVNTVCCS